MHVYLVTNLANRKQYVGQHSGSDLDKYWSHVVHKAFKSKHGRDRLLYRAIRKYGAEQFIIESLLSVTTKEELDQEEIRLIALWDLCNPKKGYNLAAGGRGSIGYKFTKEQLKRLSDAHKGIVQSEETKRKRAAKLKGQKRSIETRRKMSQAQLGNQNCLGRIESEETRKKKSLVNLGNKNAVGAVRSPEYCKAISDRQIGRQFSRETKKKMAIAARNRPPVSENTRQKLSSASKNNSNGLKALKDHQAIACRMGVHTRLHTNKGIIESNCELCKQVA